MTNNNATRKGGTMTREITGVKVYWDSQDPNNEGWAYRLYSRSEEGDEIEIESGEVDAADDASPSELVVRVAWEHGITVREDSCACEPNVDGGWAQWTRD